MREKKDSDSWLSDFAFFQFIRWLRMTLGHFHQFSLLPCRLLFCSSQPGQMPLSSRQLLATSFSGIWCSLLLLRTCYWLFCRTSNSIGCSVEQHPRSSHTGPLPCSSCLPQETSTSPLLEKLGSQDKLYELYSAVFADVYQV